MLFWLLGLWPEINLVCAIIGASVFGFFGLLLIVLWVPEGDKKLTKEAKNHVEFGYVMLATAAALLVFGTLAGAILMGVIILGLIVVLFKSVGVLKANTEG